MKITRSTAETAAATIIGIENIGAPIINEYKIKPQAAVSKIPASEFIKTLNLDSPSVALRSALAK